MSTTPSPSIPSAEDLEFGVFLTPAADRVPEILELAQFAEVSGLDHVSFQDHPYQAKFLDTWTLLTTVAARTTSIRVSPNVASLPLRPPVMLAKAAASLDVITHGRVELGLGAGAFWDGIEAAGGPRRTPGEAVEAVIEAITVMRQFWSGETVRFSGTHYRADGLRPGPVPTRPIPIWLGAYKPRMLRVTGRLADAWIPSLGYLDPAALAGHNDVIDAAALAAGRSPQSIRRLLNINGEFAGDDSRAGTSGADLLIGPPALWVDRLTALVTEQRMSGFVLATDDPQILKVYAEEVVPAVRERVTDLARSAEAVPAPQSTPAPPAEVAAGQAGGTDPTVRSRLAVQPTADDGTRLTGELDWDEDARPQYDGPERDDYTAQQLAQPQHLIDIHTALREELAQVREIVSQVVRGHLEVGQARSEINTMTMRQNNWTMGAYCQSYCRIVAGHHTLEDRSVFRHLRQAQPTTVPVIDRLEYEHRVIHEVLENLDQALVAVVDSDGYGRGGSGGLAALQQQVDLLTDTLLSHLAYEERALLHPLAQYGLS